MNHRLIFIDLCLCLHPDMGYTWVDAQQPESIDQMAQAERGDNESQVDFHWPLIVYTSPIYGLHTGGCPIT